MKENLFGTHLILRSAARSMNLHGAPILAVGRLLALADEAEHRPAQFRRLAGSVLEALPLEPLGGEPGRVELAAYCKEFGAV